MDTIQEHTRTIGIFALELSLLTAALAIPGFMGIVAVIAYSWMPIFSIVTTLLLHSFIYNPQKFVIKETSDDEYIVDLTLFGFTRELYDRISPDGHTKFIYWLVDILGVGLCIYFESHAPIFAWVALMFIILEAIAREFFVHLMNENGEVLEDIETNIRRIIKEEEEKKK